MASRRSRKTEGHDKGGGGSGHGGGAGRWMVSYSDFMTLLFVVFLVLFSMARVDNAKYEGLAKSLRQTMGTTGAFGPDITPLPTRGQVGQAMPVKPPEDPGTLPSEPDWPSRLIDPVTPDDRTPPPTEAPPEEAVRSPEESAPPEREYDPAPVSEPPADSLSDLAEAFQGMPGVSSGLLSVALQERGLVINIAGSVLFEPGKTTLKSDAQSYLANVATELAGVELPIMVEGTADSAGTANPNGYTPWDLAALRAGAVVNYFVQAHGFPGSRFVTIGYGTGEQMDRPRDVVTIVVMRKAD